MKHSSIVLFVVLFSAIITSCSSSKVVGTGILQKRKYNKGFFVQKKSTFTNNKAEKEKQIDLLTLSLTKETSEDTVVVEKAVANDVYTFEVGDSVKITLQSGVVYHGTISREDVEGLFLKTSPTREIFLRYKEIASIETVAESIVTTDKNESTQEEKRENVTSEHADHYEYYEENDQPQKHGVLTPKYTKWSRIYGILALVFGGISAILILYASSSLVLLLAMLAISLVIFCIIMANINAIIGLGKALRNSDIYSVRAARNTMILVGFFTIALYVSLLILLGP